MLGLRLVDPKPSCPTVRFATQHIRVHATKTTSWYPRIANFEWVTDRCATCSNPPVRRRVQRKLKPSRYAFLASVTLNPEEVGITRESRKPDAAKSDRWSSSER
jgi:hypothetical protein